MADEESVFDAFMRMWAPAIRAKGGISVADYKTVRKGMLLQGVRWFRDEAERRLAENEGAYDPAVAVWIDCALDACEIVGDLIDLPFPARVRDDA